MTHKRESPTFCQNVRVAGREIGDVGGYSVRGVKAPSSGS